VKRRCNRGELNRGARGMGSKFNKESGARNTVSCA